MNKYDICMYIIDICGVSRKDNTANGFSYFFLYFLKKEEDTVAFPYSQHPL